MVTTKCKIAFYGASVTQQRNGFVECFAKMSSLKVLKFGFGGMHLSDAGICFIDKVVESKPEICFVDWFSTAYSNQDSNLKLYIDAIAEKLLKIDCRVNFFFCRIREIQRNATGKIYIHVQKIT